MSSSSSDMSSRKLKKLRKLSYKIAESQKCKKADNNKQKRKRGVVLKEEEVSPLHDIFTWIYTIMLHESKKAKIINAIKSVLSLRLVCKKWNQIISKELPHLWKHACTQISPIWPLVPIRDNDGFLWLEELKHRSNSMKKYLKLHKMILGEGILTGKDILYNQLKSLGSVGQIFGDLKQLDKLVGSENFEWLTSLSTGMSSQKKALKLAVQLLRMDFFYLLGTENAIGEMLLLNSKHKMYFITPQPRGTVSSILFHYTGNTFDEIKSIPFTIHDTEDGNIEFRCSASRRTLPEEIDFRKRLPQDGHIFDLIETIIEYFKDQNLALYPLCFRDWKRLPVPKKNNKKLKSVKS